MEAEGLGPEREMLAAVSGLRGAEPGGYVCSLHHVRASPCARPHGCGKFQSRGLSGPPAASWGCVFAQSWAPAPLPGS